jgi:protease-4
MSDEKEPKQQTELQNEAKEADPWTEGEMVKDEQPAASDDKQKAEVSTQDHLKWQQDVINRLAFSSVNEQRRTRRWGIFFKSLTFIYLFAILFMFFRASETTEINLGEHTAMVEIVGPIAGSAVANADHVVSALRDAFEDKHSKGIVLRINSPGGSPVQAGYINDEIKRLRAKYPDKKVYAVVTELAASAAYYIAVSADEIYADKASMVGSIGVLMDGYGFVGVLDKLGIERRLMTAGENKAFLDPFSPLKESHQTHIQGMLDTVHQQFIDVVKEGRGDRLVDNPDIFSGLVWSGEDSVDLGLVDGLGSTSYVAREIIGAKKVVDYTHRPSFADQFADKIGASMATAMQSVLTSPSLK